MQMRTGGIMPVTIEVFSKCSLHSHSTLSISTAELGLRKIVEHETGKE